jgi:peptidoglycan LD-endopeptidase LytH
VLIPLAAPPTGAGASDPLAAAIARVETAERADNKATARYDAAQASYYELEDRQAASERAILSLTAEQGRLASLGRLRALVAYKRGSLALAEVLGNGADVLDAARRATLLDDVNASGNEAIARLETVTSELHDREATLQSQIKDARAALSSMQSQARDAEQALESAGRAENELRAQLAAQRRLHELSAILTAARARSAARSSSASSTESGGAAGQLIVHGTWVCPVQGPISFTDTYGSPRSGGRRHMGNDLFAPIGTPVVAVTDGSVFFQGDPLGGNAAYVQGNDGNTYYYAHLDDYVGGGRSVRAGELIGHVGNTGDARNDPPQLHFEIRPGSANARGVDPYTALSGHC